MKAYSKFLDIVEKIEKALLCISVAVMLVVMIYQVILRYVFAHATAWSEELARYLFIFQVMLASAIGIRRNSHRCIDSSAEAALENAEHSYFNFDRCGFPLLFTGIFY